MLYIHDQQNLELPFFFDTVGNIEKACQATASYLLFFPNDETMLENKEFYLTLDGVTQDMFVPRPEAVRYYERDEGEKALLLFIEENFQFDEGEISEAAGPDVASPFTEPTDENEISST